jgi:ribosomal protein L23
MKKDPRSIIERPLITEKNHLLQDKENKYVFEVAQTGNQTSHRSYF